MPDAVGKVISRAVDLTDWPTTPNGLYARLAVANTLTHTLTITPATAGELGLIINPPANMVNDALRIASADTGAANYGPFFTVGYNTNASGAGGWIRIFRKDGSTGDVWVDVSGNMRVGVASGNANDTGGTVVGTQTSHISAKNIVGPPISTAEALRRIVALANHVKRFVYKNGSFNGEEFSGIILDDDEPDTYRYGMDRDKGAVPAGKSLNEINGFGDVVLALAHIDAQINGILARLEAAGI